MLGKYLIFLEFFYNFCNNNFLLIKNNNNIMMN